MRECVARLAPDAVAIQSTNSMVPEKHAKANDPAPPSPSGVRQRPAIPLRAWYHDAILSLACFALCLTLGKGVSRLYSGFSADCSFFSLTAGAGWVYGKSAWRGLIEERDRR